MVKQFIRYLYEYDQGKRIRNVGFVKVEQSGARGMVHIHGKGLRLGSERTLFLYLLCEEDRGYVGIRQGEIGNINPAVNYRFCYEMKDHTVCGVLLMKEGNNYYAASWNDMPVVPEKLRLGGTSESVAKEEKLSTETSLKLDVKDGIEDEPILPSDDDLGKDMNTSVEVNSETEITQNSETEIETKNDSAPEISASEAATEHMAKCNAHRITRREIARLPRCEWKLANNRFLLHGYYNYGHLLFLEEEDGCYLGVPGVYHEKEAQAAGIFGFGKFVMAEELAFDNHTDENINKTAETIVDDNIDKKEMQAADSEEERFGYWCRRVRK